MRGLSMDSPGTFAGCEPMAMMALEGHLLAAAVDLRDVEAGRPGQCRRAAQVLDLARLGELSGAAGQPSDDVVLEGAQLVEIDLRLAELDAPCRGVPRLLDELGDVQQRL